MNKYVISNSEGQFQENSNELVMLNKLGITSLDEINTVEMVLLETLYLEIFENQFPVNSRINISMIKNWHRLWLGNVYDWAGKERTADISKGGFLFVSCSQLQKLLNEFEKKFLAIYTPCTKMNEDLLIEALSIIHVEFILIHPFRDGNGRISRLLADVMSVQGGKKPLDYQYWEQNKDEYISAIHSGLSGNYYPMNYLIKKALKII
ncbi:Fic/DOC family protein [Thorsellia kenyensis]|uniref:Fic/DOC family protein n=1 Tax=Thorsellia kenyensis TaxID=1549888 RepID=A0ABV6CCC4_9GAMM